MPPIRSASKLSSKTATNLPLSDLLSDPLNYDDALLRRFTAELNLSDASLKKQKTLDTRKLAMSAANLSSQCLGNIVRDGWKASDPSTMNGVSMNSVLSIFRVFTTAIRSLRDALMKSLDVERVVSSFIGKVVALELFQAALDLLWETKPYIAALYHDSSDFPQAPKRLVGNPPKAFPLGQYYSLLRYPMPPPTDPVITLLICTSIVQSLMAITALLSSSSSPVDTLVSYLEGSVLLDWVFVCSNEQQDSLLSRSHKAIALTLSDIDIQSDLALRLRMWSLRCLLHKPTLDPEMFWLQAVRYLITHGKPLHSARLYDQAASEAIMFFDSVIPLAKSRKDHKAFMSGSTYGKFCETILVFAQKGSNAAEAQRIVEFVKPDVKNESNSGEASRAHHTVIFGHALNTLERISGTDDDREAIESLTKCCTILSNDITVFVGADGNPKLIPCLEKLRRLCACHVEERKGGEQLRKTIITFCDSFIQGVERHKQKSDKAYVSELYTCAIDSLCSLAKSSLIPGQAWTYVRTYEYLNRATALIEIPLLPDAPNLDCSIKWVKCVSGASMNTAIALYRIDNYSHAIRFLASCCTLTTTLWDFLAAGDKRSSSIKLVEEARTYLRLALTKRWELLGDCYSKTGDRKLAHQAFIKALRFSPLGDLNDASSSLHPEEIFTQPRFKRTGNLIERITYIAAFDLIMQEHTSLHIDLVSEVPSQILGLILEQQVTSLEKGASKPEVKLAIDGLLKDTLKLYDTQYPIRRARILIWRVRLAYRNDDMEFPTSTVIAEIFSLLQIADSSDQDQGLMHFRRQYEAMGFMWGGLLLHQRSELHDKVTPMIIQQATSAGFILEELFLCRATKSPPKADRLNKQPSASAPPTKVPRIATRTSPRKKPVVVKASPVTPKSRRKIHDTSLETIEVPLPQASPDSFPFAIDPRLSSLIGHAPFKIRFLAILQQMATLSLHPAANAEAAMEYAKLGKNKRALAIFVHTLKALDNTNPKVVLNTTRILVLLGYAEVLARHGNSVKSMQLYEEARLLFQSIEHNPSYSSSSEKLKNKAQIIELSARAARVYALINVAKVLHQLIGDWLLTSLQGNLHTSLSALRQSLKLWNRAYETLLRVSPDSGVVKSNGTISNPFDMGPLSTALPRLGNEVEIEKETYRRNSLTEHIHWCIAEGLFRALLDLADAYFLQGSIRGSEYLVEQARSLATAINSTNYVGRAITSMVEIYLHRRMLEDANSSLHTGNKLIGDSDNINAAEIARLSAQYQQLLDNNSQATSLYTKAMALMSDFNKILSGWERPLSSPRRSSTGMSDSNSEIDIFIPDFQAAILAQQIWLQRNASRSVVNELMRKLDALPSSTQIQLEKAVISAKLALHEAYAKFRSDIFLSSLPESTIAIPMGLVSKDGKNPSIGTKILTEMLSLAQTCFEETLQRVRNYGKVTYAREALLSLTTLRLFKASLGHSNNDDASVAINLLHASAALTLRRELVEAIDQKFPTLLRDDFAWPSLSEHGQYQIPTMLIEEDGDRDAVLKMYWSALRSRYIHDHNLEDVKNNPIDVLPDNWTVINISLTDDKNTILISRQCPTTQPLIFCVPIDRQGRKENENEHFTFEDGSLKLKEILGQSDQIAKTAKDVASDDRNSKVAWWAKRTALDKQLREFLENIEFCWLGGFKTVLHERRQISIDELNAIGDRMVKVFQRVLVSEKKRIARLKFNPTLVECFLTLPSQCRQEELEDIIYFILDLYQFHGIHIPLSEIDIDELAVQFRSILEECTVRKFAPVEDAHLFLVLDKNVQGIPWESIPFLRGRSVSRIPSLSFLLDRVEFAKVQRQLKNIPVSEKMTGKAVVNPKNVYFILNPSGDLERSQARFEPWLKEMSDRSIGWKGTIGRNPSELEFTDALKQKDLVIYIGHGGAEQYVRSNKIKHLPCCAATMLWGCSSGFLHEMGDFDRHGTPYNYMIAGCPTLIACLWDVTDNELDRFSQSVFDKLRLNGENINNWKDDGSVSVVTAVAESREWSLTDAMTTTLTMTLPSQYTTASPSSPISSRPGPHSPTASYYSASGFISGSSLSSSPPTNTSLFASGETVNPLHAITQEATNKGISEEGKRQAVKNAAESLNGKADGNKYLPQPLTEKVNKALATVIDTVSLTPDHVAPQTHSSSPVPLTAIESEEQPQPTHSTFLPSTQAEEKSDKLHMRYSTVDGARDLNLSSFSFRPGIVPPKPNSGFQVLSRPSGEELPSLTKNDVLLHPSSASGSSIIHRRRNTTGGVLPQRPSNQLSSIHNHLSVHRPSDLPAFVDSDILEQANQIRKQRLSKRAKAEAKAEAEARAPKEKEEEVLVGNLIGEDHVNYVLMYNMLTGIRVAVSRCQAKNRRALTDEDFTARHKFSFDIIGNELTPSAKYDFKFKDYAPWVFRELREDYFCLDPADYLLSLTAKYILSELGSPGKSGSFFYFSRDYRFIIKTIHHSEHKFLLKILKEYYSHVKSNPNTLLSRFYGLHRVKLPHGRKIHFVIMNNLFPPHRDIHETYDLKGSTVGRIYPEEKAAHNPRAVLKDLNWIDRKRQLELGPEKRAYLAEQLRLDLEFLKKVNVMDYSLLVGIHSMERGNRDNLRSNTLRVFSPDVPRARRRSSHAKINKEDAVALKRAMRRLDPKALGTDRDTTKLPDQEPVDDRQYFVFYRDEGGYRATDEFNQPNDTIYYLGIIDICTPYNVVKKVEHFWKGLSADRHKISPVNPVEYAQRFFNFLTAVMRGGDGGERFKAE
ncbi:hypothetical protein Clacol_009271 [Clathrus columnatus]|uniref:1-phosphatidylinositol 4-phosphate kinase n=1 Tax=Clathrus columnatus TaxID=1419009 RepID=A0AAV5AKQ7_9AGAM|nr:hypothetical protein Clacol_009271 [Clathrus columnatus]